MTKHIGEKTHRGIRSRQLEGNARKSLSSKLAEACCNVILQLGQMQSANHEDMLAWDVR